MTAEEERQFVPLLAQLEAPLAEAAIDVPTATSLVRWVLANSTDYWCDLALAWVEQGVDAQAVQSELTALADAGRKRPQTLRHRAKRLIPKVP